MMRLPLFTAIVGVLLIGDAALLGDAARAAASRPNILVVLCDDLGYGDLNCYGGHDLKTPHLDRFAAEGLRLTHCYSAHPNCSPARTGLLTGRTPMRVGVHNWIPMLSPMHVPSSEVTIATLLRDAGYDTALSGKWHLNGRFNLPGQPQPSDHGFRHWFATQNNCLPNHKDPYNFVRNGIPLGPLRGYAADLVAAEAIHWLQSVRDKSQPFFLFVSFHEPHEPISTNGKFAALYSQNDPSYAAHHGNISQMDQAFGDLLQTIDDQGMRDNTFVLFTSDNGPAKTSYHPHGSAGSLRDKKGYISDGGIRVPGIVRWPGKTSAGSVSDTPIIGTDLLPTLCEIAGVAVPTDRPLDGASIVPLFHDQAIRRSTPLYWHFYAARGRQKVAIRIGDWKLSAEIRAGEVRDRAGIDPIDQQTLKTAPLDNMALYNLRNDHGEAVNLGDAEPIRFREMKAILETKYREVQSESPTWSAWKSPRYEAQRIVWPSYHSARPKLPVIPPQYHDNPLIDTVE